VVLTVDDVDTIADSDVFDVKSEELKLDEDWVVVDDALGTMELEISFDVLELRMLELDVLS
jgi:hypothetical protein